MGGLFVTDLFTCFAFTNNKGTLEKEGAQTLGHKDSLFIPAALDSERTKPAGHMEKGNYTGGLMFSPGTIASLPESILRGGDRAGLNKVASTKIP